jgi:hypothetical protein
MMQWVPFGQRLNEFKAHVQTFRDVFPHVILAFGPGGYGLYMLGSEEPIAFDDDAIRSVLRRPGVLEDISSARDSRETTEAGWVARIRGLVWLSDGAVAAFAGDAPLITDDRPLPEYFFLRRVYGPRSLPMTRETLLLTGGG